MAFGFVVTFFQKSFFLSFICLIFAPPIKIYTNDYVQTFNCYFGIWIICCCGTFTGDIEKGI